MSTWNDFGILLSKAIGRIFAKVVTQHKAEFSQILANSIFDDPGPKELSRTATAREKFARRIFSHFTEIHSSLDALRSTEIYLRRFPFSGTSITKVGYLKYNVANYLNEVYILKTRIDIFLTRIGREYRKDKRHSKIVASTSPLISQIKGALNGIISTRGVHVHEKRFSDEELSKLELLHHLSSDLMPEIKAFRKYYDFEYRRIRAKWMRQVRENNASLVPIMDEIAKSLTSALLTKNGRLRFPPNLH